MRRTSCLRVHGLRLLADVAPDLLPYYAAEHLDDRARWADEPANTAFQLLAGTGNHAAIYQWLISGERDAPMVAAAFELLADAPRAVVERYVARTVDVAIRKQDDALSTVLAEAIVNLEMEASYDALARMMSAKISDELYDYLAVLLAGKNRAPLLRILERELHRSRRPHAVAEALRVRTTPGQAAILKRWEDGGEMD